MKIIRDIDNIPEDLTGSIVTIGNFDGVHLGHRKIFRNIVKEAGERNKKSVVITFDPHPQKIIHPERRPFFLLTPLNEKLDLIRSCDVDAVILITFSIEFAEITAGEFVENILWGKLRLSKLLVGYDYVFGKGKGGDAEFLKTSGRKLGFQVEEIDAVKTDGMISSSTGIRLAILDGNVRQASEMLGRPYGVTGTVVKGYRRGTDIGYPTANIKSEKVIPATGVYAIIAELEGIRHQGVINIGYNPTFGNEEISAEVHLLDFEGDIYGRDITVLFIDRLRDEMKFKGPEELARQIKRDVEKAREILSSRAEDKESGTDLNPAPTAKR
ncbi:MAG: bifunctional riboflavin kinase/FAD synthetase [Deltaproteobacteria bacterium]|nr:bifunctional riboflavin kinase/FAD synthetase [Deltaproteobacteria bacterium]MBW2649134.1 bifunctional riboflavin kinase/FAD synthetase [Deltaproteobacteria bacterium]